MGTLGTAVGVSADETTRRMRPPAATDSHREPDTPPPDAPARPAAGPAPDARPGSAAARTSDAGLAPDAATGPEPEPQRTRAATRRTQQLPPDGAVIANLAALPTDRRPLPPDARGAIIIPAHDEAAVIARTLRALAPLAAFPGIEVIVACNGCGDDTAAIAREFPGVRVVETDRGSKPIGLNLGDGVATAWPRLYLDADIEIDPHAVLDVFAELARPGVFAARPRFVYDTSGATLPVRAYYRARSRIPSPPRMWGAGGYAANEAGHRRFGEFAAVTADDSWFDGLFADAEKRIVATTPTRVRTPRDSAALLAVLTRQRRGYREIGVASEARSRGRALLASVRGPRSAIDAAWYVALTLTAWRRARAATRRATPTVWERDASSRAGAVA